MTYKHSSVQAMVDHPHSSQIPTAPLVEFIEEYEDDDNTWWRIACGHHQNLFEMAVEERAELKEWQADMLAWVKGVQIAMTKDESDKLRDLLARAGVDEQ